MSSVCISKLAFVSTFCPLSQTYPSRVYSQLLFCVLDDIYITHARLWAHLQIISSILCFAWQNTVAVLELHKVHHFLSLIRCTILKILHTSPLALLVICNLSTKACAQSALLDSADWTSPLNGLPVSDDDALTLELGSALPVKLELHGMMTRWVSTIAWTGCGVIRKHSTVIRRFLSAIIMFDWVHHVFVPCGKLWASL